MDWLKLLFEQNTSYMQLDITGHDGFKIGRKDDMEMLLKFVNAESEFQFQENDIYSVNNDYDTE